MSTTMDNPESGVGDSYGTEGVSVDHSLLLRPISIKNSTIQSIVNIVCKGTKEVRNLLMNECEMILECRVCRSLHRSLANFIAHKRVYCTEHCCESMKLFDQVEIESETLVVNPDSPESVAVNEDENAVDKSLSVMDTSVDLPDDSNCLQTDIPVSLHKIYKPVSKDVCRRPFLTEKTCEAVADEMTSGSAGKFYSGVMKHLENRSAGRSESVIRLTAIGGNSNAVFQAVNPKAEELEIENVNVDLDLIMSVSEADDKAVTVEENETVDVEEEKEEEVEEEEEEEEAEEKEQRSEEKVHDTRPTPVVLRPSTKNISAKSANIRGVLCIRCGASFTSIKTLTLHTKSAHNKVKAYFNCLYCAGVFRDLWSVTRHMLTVHKKSNAQLDKLKSRIRQQALQNVANDRDSSEEWSADEIEEDRVREPKSKLPVFIDQLKCIHCDKVFANKNSLSNHLRAKHRPRAVSVKQEPTANGRPKRIVKKRVNADFIDSNAVGFLRGSSFKQRVQLTSIEKKIRSLINLKTLMCVRCHRTFCNASNLRRHVAKHLGWKRYKCTHCSYEAYNRYTIFQHIKRIHKNQSSRHDGCVEPHVGDGEQHLVEEAIEVIRNTEAQSTKLDDGYHCEDRDKQVVSSSSGCNRRRGKKTSQKELPQNGSRKDTLFTKPSHTPSSNGFNISTRQHPRHFDTSPYQRPESSMTLVTRSGAYLKTELVRTAHKKDLPETKRQKTAVTSSAQQQQQQQ